MKKSNTETKRESAKKKSFRSKVMKYAGQIWKATGQPWRICVTKAWRVYKLAKDMREGNVVFYYLKSDGSVRKAIGTLRNLPAGITLGGKRITKPSYKTMAYYDTEKQAFRCFRVENLIM